MKLALQLHPARVDDELLASSVLPVLDRVGCEYYQLPRNHSGAVKLQPDTDLICSLGGDGTFLHGSRVAIHHGLPIFGVRVGRLGFLCNTKLKDLGATVTAIMEGRMPLEERHVLHGRILSGGKVTYEQLALNDIVLQRKQTDKLRDFKAQANGRLIANYRGDGILLGTPLGSTAYNMSAGGPLVHPSLEVILLTPICAHSLFTKPLVLPLSDRIEISGSGGITPMTVSYDGEFQHPLNDGDTLEVTGYDIALKVFRPAEYDFFAVLREKFQHGYVYGGEDD